MSGGFDPGAMGDMAGWKAELLHILQAAPTLCWGSWRQVTGDEVQGENRDGWSKPWR